MARGFCLESRAPREYKMTDSTTTVRQLAGFDQLIEAYDGFIFDVWGTLYDGRAAYDGAVAVLQRLADRGKPVAILSNSPQRPEVVAGRLARIGIDNALYQTLVTSGGETHDHLRGRLDSFHADLGPRVFETGPDRFPNLLDDTAFTAVDRIEDADLLLNTGPNEPLETVADYRVLLDHALSRNLPMICANPDLHVYVGHEIHVCAGSLAAEYQSRGGTVRYHGKPHAGVFRTATARLRLPATRCLMVGDNYRTDVRGACALGMGALWLADGIDRDDLLTDRDVDLTKAGDLLRSDGLSGVWVMARLA